MPAAVAVSRWRRGRFVILISNYLRLLSLCRVTTAQLQLNFPPLPLIANKSCRFKHCEEVLSHGYESFSRNVIRFLMYRE